MVRLAPHIAALRLPTPASAPAQDDDLPDALGATPWFVDFAVAGSIAPGTPTLSGNNPVNVSAVAAPFAAAASVVSGAPATSAVTAAAAFTLSTPFDTPTPVTETPSVAPDAFALGGAATISTPPPSAQLSALPAAAPLGAASVLSAPAPTAIVSANLLLFDDFSSFSTRNGLPSGANKFRNSQWHTPAGDTYPENWPPFGGYTAGGITTSIVGRGNVTVDGQSVPWIDVRFQGTASAGDHGVAFDLGVIPAANGQTWTASAYMALAAGTLTGVTQVRAVAEYVTAEEGGSWTGGAYATAAPLTGTMTRYSASGGTASNSTNIRPLMIVTTTAGAVDVTVRVGGVQIEQAASASALVQTTSDSGRWNTRLRWGPNTTINSEAQYYADTALYGTTKSNGANPFDVATDAGSLRIVGSTVPGGQNASYANNKAYVSGVITTLNHFKRQYGYFEMRARFPAGAGLWPAFWLLPHTVDASGAAINAAQIDVVRWRGNAPTTVAGSVIAGDGTATTRSTTVGATDATSGYHTYGVEWTADTVRWFYDGVQYGADVATPADCKQPMYLIVDLAMGGAAGSVDGAALPAPLRIDFVKVWDARPF